MTDLPDIALAVRQPWAWAIIHGGKDIENRSRFAITKGKIVPKRVAILASIGMTQDEYRDAADFMRRIGVICPPPAQLVRGGIIGAVDVMAVVKASGSKWFFGPRGLVLANASPCDPIPASGQLGYFPWRRHGGGLAAPLRWMGAAPGPDLLAAAESEQP